MIDYTVPKSRYKTSCKLKKDRYIKIEMNTTTNSTTRYELQVTH